MELRMHVKGKNHPTLLFNFSSFVSFIFLRFVPSYEMKALPLRQL